MFTQTHTNTNINSHNSHSQTYTQTNIHSHKHILIQTYTHRNMHSNKHTLKHRFNHTNIHPHIHTLTHLQATYLEILNIIHISYYLYHRNMHFVLFSVESSVTRPSPALCRTSLRRRSFQGCTGDCLLPSCVMRPSPASTWLFTCTSDQRHSQDQVGFDGLFI